MGFWIFMFLTSLLIPLTMIFFGQRFRTKAPKNINYIFGYRTARSMKTPETWVFAHRTLGRLWFWGGVILLPFSIAAMLLVRGQSSDAIGITGSVLTLIQLLPLAGAILPTEIALKKNFDESGRQR